MHTVRYVDGDSYSVLFITDATHEYVVAKNMTFIAACSLCNFLNGGDGAPMDEARELVDMAERTVSSTRDLKIVEQR